MAVEILTPKQQREQILNATSFERFESFLDKNFKDFSAMNYRTRLREAFATGEIPQNNPDFYKLQAVFATQVARDGFSLMAGQLYKHRDRKWQKSPFSVEHTLASACYSARVALETDELREKQLDQLIRAVPNEVDKLWLGLWGLMGKVEGGKVIGTPYTTNDILKTELEGRMKEKRPIYLPGDPMTLKLAELNIKGEEVEQVSSQDFADKYFAGVSDAIGEVVDPSKLFGRQRLERLYSFESSSQKVALAV